MAIFLKKAETLGSQALKYSKKVMKTAKLLDLAAFIKNVANKVSAASAAFQAFWPEDKTLPQGELTSPEDIN
ncbi:hypothetical protein SDC9_190479 [bioreactor metagenome]|uniref:Uncharacterized protein n=1 Tax=bioreactor metagenome TaxID=1076179 RepID=A0A645HV39_9ZZZZ